VVLVEINFAKKSSFFLSAWLYDSGHRSAGDGESLNIGVARMTLGDKKYECTHCFA
jgi:hypothetical protein